VRPARFLASPEKEETMMSMSHDKQEQLSVTGKATRTEKSKLSQNLIN
jgi:hypothetical protein